jgi:predicted XRE-type DNA-binding protein
LENQKELVWMASSRHDMRALPRPVQRAFGVALWAVQIGETPPSAKAHKGFGGAGMLELIENDSAGTYRAGDEGEQAMKRDHEKSSGNVFADLGFRNAKQELLKAKLTVEIYKQLKAREVTQHDAAKLLGTTQAQVSALMRCNPVSVSVGRLMEFLTALGQDVKVTVKPAPRSRKAGKMSVVVQDEPHVA